MANLNSNGTGNFTTAGTWGVLETSSFLNSETNQTGSTTTFVSSQNFLPGIVTIEGIGIKISTRSTTTGGTFSVRLFNVTGGAAVAGTTVTVNVTDLPVNMNGWAFFRFSSPITTTILVTYNVQISSSVNGGVTVFRDATAGNWSRFLRTSTNQAPGAGDNLIVTGQYTGAGTNNTFTVTMNNTAATAFGFIEVSGKGILTCGTAAATNYQLVSGGTGGSFYVNGDGIVQWGTSGTPIPATSTMKQTITQNGVAVTNGILLRGNGNFTTFGSSKTQKAFLNADAAAAATSITSDISTGWKSGDLIGVASTTRTSGQTETATLTADATGTTIPISALSFAHSGTGATKGELANLTRNVKIQGETTSLTAYFNVGAGTTFNFNNTEVYFMGSATGAKRGVDISTDSTGSFLVDGCVWRDFTNSTNFGFLMNSPTNANITIQNTNLYNITSTGLSINSLTLTASTVVVNNILSMLAPITLNGQASTTTNITAVSTTITFGATTILPGYTVDNIVSHSSGAAGISMGSATLDMAVLTNITAWRNTTRGIFFSGAGNIQMTNVTTFGNGTSGVEIATSSLIYINNMTANAGTTLLQPTGISLTGSGSQVYLDSCSFGATTTHATGDITVSTLRSYHECYLTNCLLLSTNEVASQSNLAAYGIVGSIKHDQTTGTHKSWKRVGTITSDTTINSTSPLSQRITPSSATSKILSGTKTFSIPSGKTAKFTVGVRRSVAGDGTAYNGNLPRLWLRSNNSAGISSDILLATASAASSGAWEFITGTVPAANDNTVNSVYVDLDGTTGWVNLDVWKLEIINGSANGTNVNSEDYWQDGSGFTGVNTMILRNTGHETFWLNGNSVQEVFPVSATETGKFFLLFD